MQFGSLAQDVLDNKFLVVATVDLQTGQKMLKVEIALPSGHCETLSVRQSSKIGALRILAQKLFGRGS